MSVTIKDIAKMAAVSHTTVSRALNDSPLIHWETKRKIKAIAAEMNYIPNINARSLVLDRSYHVGLFFSTLNRGTTPHFLYDVIRGVNAIIKEKYHLIVKGIDDYDSRFSNISRRSFDGIILMSQSKHDDKFIKHVISEKIPLIVLNRHVSSRGVINILSDDRAGAYKVVEYIIQQGHKRIAIILGKEGFGSSVARRDGYLKAMHHYQIAVNDDYLLHGDYNMESGYSSMNKLLELEELPTAVFCSDDETAVGAMKAIVEKGLSVPGDISVAGFDDNEFSKYISPSLTSVKRPIEQISMEGARKLLDLIDKKTVSAEKEILLNTELVIRESVRAIEQE